jgi:uncharacterized membrane protein YfcA
VIVPIPAMAANISLLFGAGHLQETFQRFWKFYPATIPGIFFGTMLLGVVDQRPATQVLGAITIFYVFYAVVRPDFSLPDAAAQRLMVPAGLLNGFLTGLTGSQILPLLPYMMSLKLSPAHFVKAVNIAVVTASLILLMALFVSGLMTWPLALMSVIGIVPATIGTYIGNLARTQIPAPRFRMVVLVTLFAIGVSFVANLNTFFAALAG